MALRRGMSGLIPVLRLWRPSTFAWRPNLRQQWRCNATLSPGPVPQQPSRPGIVLRDYQEECIQSVLDYIKQGHKRLGISLATGAGKTVIFTQLIGRIPPRNETGNRTLILAHRRELVDQAAAHCRAAYPDRTVSIEMSNSKSTGTADITIASIRSLLSQDRLAKFDPARFKLILVDEAHHIVAPTYRAVLDHFGLKEPTPDSPVLVGVSATFARADGLRLGAAIDHIVYHKDYMDMINDKWLANAVFTTVQSNAKLSGVKSDSRGDFQLESLARAVNTDTTNTITVRAWLANAADRHSTLVFCVNVEHTRSLTDTFRAHGIDARYITGDTPQKQRDAELAAFKAGEFPVLLNCGLFTEGTDIPNIDCVLLARPTRSQNLLVQMIGRGLRLHPGKKDCHIIDMVGTVDAGVVSTPTLFGLHPDEIINAATATELTARPTQQQQPTTQPPEDIPSEDTKATDSDNNEITLSFTKYDTIYDLIHDLKSEKHIRSLSRYAWVRVASNTTTPNEEKYILSDDSGWLTITRSSSSPPSHQKDAKEQQETYTLHHVQKYTSPTTLTPTYTRPRLLTTTTSLSSAVHAADTFASAHFTERYISSQQGWRRGRASAAQIAYLNKARIREGKMQSSDLTRGQAADLITKLKFGGKGRVRGERVARERRERVVERREREVEKLRRERMVGVGPVGW
ncbi:ResIII-domain-containing protein [Aspergillus campestris IBT 28561]|uniref:ResIII-domain-containing protein n=1 Tax=Aspergillus campestris (strain IBT 28561) TaxID=1392248 RepID=A0A2I1D564_ASPC2|nr:ResIII-domain-containing protein [Aspergillus campestris IBT 28561]PKY05016.1 ResIII-domain-containing protein [Aspergillus campestris IBT 28561]